MSSAQYETYEQAKERLDQIVTDVRDKDISLEASLDLLDEGVELANRCSELIDVVAWEDQPDEGQAGEADGSLDPLTDATTEGNV